MITLSLAVTAVVLLRRHLPARPIRERADRPDPLGLALIIRIGLSAGLSLSRVLAMAASHVDSATAGRLRQVERDGLASGLTAALSRRDEPSSRLFRLLADAHLTGAPMVFAVNTFINDELERQRIAALHQARVLPVRLTIPVALGLLPGFVLLAIAPQVVLALRDLLGQVAGL